jgi:hypothetical protein
VLNSEGRTELEEVSIIYKKARGVEKSALTFEIRNL